MVSIPIIRKLIPSIIAKELVGVQPMSTPAGQVFSMGARYSRPKLFCWIDEYAEYSYRVRIEGYDYDEILNWCKSTYDSEIYNCHGQTLTFKYQKHLDWFILKWSSND